MANGSENKTDLQTVQDWLSVLFSWVVLLGISVIISGKLAARHIVLGFGDDDLFTINLVAFKIRARGDEVSLGFTIFLLCLALVILIGGQGAYIWFKDRAGIDVGHWNSMCIIASFLSIFCAVLLWASRALFGYAPIVSQQEREDQIRRIISKGSQADANGEH